jgi:6-phosphogluconolactonase
MAIEEHSFTSIDVAARSLAVDLASTMREAISARGRALLAVSGGRTPELVFNHLKQQEVDWSRVTLTLTDERWVPVDHPDSNEGLVRSFLMQGPVEALTFISLYGGEISPEAGQLACETRLMAMARPFDAVYLGTAGDGHFASLFPGDHALEARDSLCVAIPQTESRLPRISLTVSTILDTRKVFLLFAGADKRAAFDEARKPGSYRDLPLRLVLLQEQIPVDVFAAP